MVAGRVKPIAVHIRRGDYVNDPNNLSFFGVQSLQYYYNAIDYLEQHVSNPHLYIFSDDLCWVKENLKTTLATTFMEIDGGTKDYLELDAMSKCRHNIIANSSFSWWGAFLNKNREKIVIVPKQWVVDDTQNEKIQIQFPDWIKM